MGAIEKFLDSPANRTGISIWLGTLITALLQYFLLHVAPPSADLLGLVLGFVKIVQPENAITLSQLQKAMADLGKAVETKDPVAVGLVISDAAAIASALTADKHAS